jgi:gliding motility-associated-like protein
VGQAKVYGAIDPTSYTYILSTPLIGSDLLTGALTRVPGETAGSYAISQGTLANSNYNITYVGNNFNITKATLTITAEDKSKLYGAAVPALTYKYLGLVNGDLAPSTLPAITTTALASSPVDSYPITVSAAADANYTINYVQGILKVDKAPLIITAENKTKVYGEVNPILTYTYSGLINGDLATITWPTIITAALPNSPVGTYPIIPSAAVDPNYTISYVNGTLTVTKAPLTITAKPHTITYNGTAYSGGNGVVPTGLAAGESISNLTGTLTYAGTSQGAKNVDTYTIIPGGLSSLNYNINYVGDALEIKKATLNIIAGDQSVNFGTPASKILTDATFSYASLLGGDNDSDITGSVTYTTNYTPLTSNGASGIYIEPIITGLSNSNYDIIAVKGTITITAPPSSPVFQIPNAFTPNSDGHNDTFKIIQNGYVTSIISFRIFTKSGKLIFNDKDGAWDGRFGGVMLDADVYIWIADFINKNNDTEHLSGTVLLLK